MHKLIFVYNATSGKINGLFDIAHKLISPKTYQCKLCMITHNTFSENEQWKLFRKTTKLPLVFLHSDELEQQYSCKNVKYPAIFLETDQQLTMWISKREIEEVKNANELIDLLRSKTKTMNFSALD